MLTEAVHQLPLDTFVVKVASRCNLNCDYCYVYHAGDTSFRDLPRRMPQKIVTAFVERLREHILTTGVPTVSIILHGGEPLLAGWAFLVHFVETIRAALPSGTRASFGLQTNGTLLTESSADDLCDVGMKIGISLDGPAMVNDIHRLDHQRRSSQALTEKAVRIMLANDRRRKHFSGVLSVIDPKTDPIAIFEYFRALGVASVDFLLPDATHDKPPSVTSQGSHGDWLEAMFEHWIEQEPEHLRVRFFETIVELLLGHDRSVDYLGGRPTRIAVIETDGSIEPVDVLKICGDGFTKIGLNVVDDPLADLRKHWLGAAYAAGSNNLCAVCRACPVADVCGGGYLPHRYSRARGFDNPSVYCRDLKRLIEHADKRLRELIPDNPNSGCPTGVYPAGSANSARRPPIGAVPSVSTPL
jgi:uncharacterized protein